MEIPADQDLAVEGDNTPVAGWVRWGGLFLGPAALLAWLYASPFENLTPIQNRLSAILLLTIIWWLTEPIPIAATGLLAVSLTVFLGALPPELSGSAARTVLAPFADPSVFFLLGGMFLARAMVRHGLDRRLALGILTADWAARSPGRLLIAVGLAVGLVSMLVSNTASTAMVYPVVLGIIAVLGARSAEGPASFARSPFATSLLLMTAYSSSIGGIATPIGTATNVVAIGFFRQPEYLGQEMDFGRWMMIGVPVAVAGFVGTAIWLWWLGPARDLDLPALREYLQAERDRRGPMSRGEWNTLFVLVVIVTLWFIPSLVGLVADPDFAKIFHDRCPEPVVALLAPVLLYLLPVDGRKGEMTLEPGDFARIDWSTMLLFGSGLSLGNLMFHTGLAAHLGEATLAVVGTSDPWVITALAIVGGVVLSEFTSNAASAATLIPVVLSLCRSAGTDPMPALFAVTFAASFGSALPVSTPPNAIVYGSGYISMGRMVRAGLGIDLMAVGVIWIVLRVAWELGWRMTG